MATAALPLTEREVYRSRFYDPRGVDRSYIRALPGGWYRRFEVNAAGGTVREVDVTGDSLDPRIRHYADEAAEGWPSTIAEVVPQ
jgi:hypothetical protein